MVQKVIDQKGKFQKKEVKKVDVPKLEVLKEEKQNETGYVMDSFIETLWDQFEGAVSRSRKFREQHQELFLKALKETTKFNGEYRKTLKGFYEEAAKLNGDLSNVLFQNNIIKTTESAQEVTESLKSQVSEGASKLEALYLTPIKGSFDLIERAEKLFEQNSETYFEYANEVGNDWEDVTDTYLKQARKNHLNIAHRLEDSARVLVAPSK